MFVRAKLDLVQGQKQPGFGCKDVQKRFKRYVCCYRFV